MEPPPDLGVFRQFLDWTWAALAALGTILYKMNDKKHEDRRKGEIKLHEKLEAHAQEDRQAFRSLENKIDANHREVMQYLMRKSNNE